MRVRLTFSHSHFPVTLHLYFHTYLYTYICTYLLTIYSFNFLFAKCNILIFLFFVVIFALMYIFRFFWITFICLYERKHKRGTNFIYLHFIPFIHVVVYCWVVVWMNIFYATHLLCLHFSLFVGVVVVVFCLQNKREL